MDKELLKEKELNDKELEQVSGGNNFPDECVNCGASNPTAAVACSTYKNTHYCPKLAALNGVYTVHQQLKSLI